MKTLAKAVGLKDDASEAEILSAFNATREGAKAIELRVLEATGAKSIDAALGTIKAGVEAVAQLATVTKSLEVARVDGEKRDRDGIIAKAVADKKLTPALKTWALATEKAADGSDTFKVSLETLKSFIENAPTIAAFEPGPSAHSAIEQRPEGAKAWEELSFPELHNLNEASPGQYAALKADWEKRGKPAAKKPKA